MAVGSQRARLPDSPCWTIIITNKWVRALCCGILWQKGFKSLAFVKRVTPPDKNCYRTTKILLHQKMCSNRLLWNQISLKWNKQTQYHASRLMWCSVFQLSAHDWLVPRQRLTRALPVISGRCGSFHPLTRKERFFKEKLFLVIGAAALCLTFFLWEEEKGIQVEGDCSRAERESGFAEPSLALRREAKGKRMCSMRARKSDFPSSQSAETALELYLQLLPIDVLLCHFFPPTIT